MRMIKTLVLAALPCLAAVSLQGAEANGQPERGKFVGTWKGFAVEGDTLKWCVSPQKVRPETFETKKGQFLLMLKRQKGEAPTPNAEQNP